MRWLAHHPFAPQLAVYLPRRMHRHAIVGVALVLLLVLNFRSWGLFAGNIALALVAYGLLYRWHDWRRHGPGGKPLAALQDGVLFFINSEGFKPFVEIPLAELAEVVVHGRVSERRFRFIRKNGEHRELQLFFGIFGRQTEAALSQFFTAALSQASASNHAAMAWRWSASTAAAASGSAPVNHWAPAWSLSSASTRAWLSS